MHETSKDLFFHWADYLVLALSLLLSLGVGVFFYIHDKKKHKNATNEEFLMGGRNINPFSVGLSFLASFLNAVFLIGVPAEVYYNGAIYALIGVAWLPVVAISAHVLVPMYRKMKITSAYEYLEVRFDSMATRLAGSIVFTGAIILFLAVVLYAPALAFAQVTGLSIHLIQVVCGLICTVYVFLGGLKAVVWTDTIQMIIAILGTIVIAAVGTSKVGGAAEVWRINEEDNRINFNIWSADPRIRHTVWTQTILNIFIWLPNYAGNQMSIQRYLAVATDRDAKIALWVNLAGAYLLLAMVTVCGLVMYAYFRQCDPLVVKGHQRVTKADQLFPLLLMELLGEYHGLPGLYTSAVFAAALSSVSTVVNSLGVPGGCCTGVSSAVNSLAAVVLEDFVKPLYTVRTKQKMQEKHAMWVSRGLTLGFGLLTIALSYIAPLLGDAIIQIPTTIWGVVGAPLFGMFVLAIFFPSANAIGTITGLIVSLIFALWWSIGAILYASRTAPIMPLGTDCDITTNTTTSLTTSYDITTVSTTTTAQYQNALQDFYDVSYTYYGLINTSLCVIVGLLVSAIVNYVNKRQNRKVSDVNGELVYDCGSNCLCCCPVSVQRWARCGLEPTVNKVQPEPETQPPDSTSETKDGAKKAGSEGKENPALQTEPQQPA